MPKATDACGDAASSFTRECGGNLGVPDLCFLLLPSLPAPSQERVEAEFGGPSPILVSLPSHEEEKLHSLYASWPAEGIYLSEATQHHSRGTWAYPREPAAPFWSVVSWLAWTRCHLRCLFFSRPKGEVMRGYSAKTMKRSLVLPVHTHVEGPKTEGDKNGSYLFCTKQAGERS